MGASNGCVEISSCSSITVPADSRVAARLSEKLRATADSTSQLDQGGEAELFESIGGAKVPSRNPSRVESSRPFGKLVKAFDPTSHRSSICSGDGSPRSLKARRSSKCSTGTCSTSDSPGGSPRSALSPDNDDDLLRAVRTGSFKSVEQALLSGSAPQARTLREQTPLMLAAGCDGEECTAIMEKLVAAGCDIEAADGDGLTPLMHACANTNLEAAEWLIQKGAAVNAKACNGRTPIMLAAQNNKGSLSLVKYLTQQGARLDVRDDDGWSLFFCACDHMNYALIRWLLLRCGADLEEKARDGHTPLAILQRHGIGRQEGRYPRKSNLDRVLLDMDKLQGKDSRVNSSSSPRRQRAAARQRQHSPRGSPRRDTSPAGSLSQISPAGSPRSVAKLSSSQNDILTSRSQELGSTTGNSAVRGGGSPGNSPPSSVRTSRKSSPRSPRSRRVKRLELGVPAAAWQAPEDVEDCKAQAMVHMYVPAGALGQDCKNYKCYINDSMISSDSELLRYIAEWGPSTV
eukprot:TRINITY_DN13297_c0_g1_i1.p1 TRINITY_DN13297_c0_g1~~TRINITY_DN13297_c0_g1_i1.p1  ORF type:complete len:526 (+),score=68.36 TRINITY_DN13297_c0_g1_i1:29-1579(+)